MDDNSAVSVQLAPGASVDSLLDAVRGAVENSRPSEDSAPVRLAVISGWRQGSRLFRRWAGGRDSWLVLRRALEKAMAAAAKAEHYPDSLLIDLGFKPARVDPADFRTLGRAQVGIDGVAVMQGTKLLGVMAPSEMIARNLDFPSGLKKLLKGLKMPPDAVEKGEVDIALFPAVQLLIQIGTPISLDLLWRGGQIVRESEIDGGRIRRFTEDMMTWMRNQIGEDGRIMYEYLPSLRRESGDDSSVRQAMVTFSLNRMALFTGRADDRVLADRNLDYLLRTYYRQDGPLAYLFEGKWAKLGAIAGAALAIAENPGGDRYREHLEALSATITALWQPDGSFRTFLKPAERNDNQEFFPGEALLYWAILLARGDPAIDPDRFRRSFHHYRGFFREKLSAPFVPWHTQAYHTALPALPDIADEMTAFIFEMSDWLIVRQQWNNAPFPDLKGRFYGRKAPRFGLSHASSTGVFLEGLIDAYELARRVGDAARSERYRLVILRGLRFLCQLQFRSPQDMFYIADRKRVFGGLRTEVSSNAIRGDSMQHALLGVFRVLDRLSPEEFRLVAEG